MLYVIYCKVPRGHSKRSVRNHIVMNNKRQIPLGNEDKTLGLMVVRQKLEYRDKSQSCESRQKRRGKLIGEHKTDCWMKDWQAGSHICGRVG